MSSIQPGIESTNQPSTQFLFPESLLLYQRLIVKTNSASTDTFA